MDVITADHSVELWIVISKYSFSVKQIKINTKSKLKYQCF